MEYIVGLGVAAVYWGVLRLTRNAPEGTLRHRTFVIMGGGGPRPTTPR